MTNFILVDFGSPERAAEVAEGLLRRGLVPRTFGAGHPIADHLRLTVRDPDENDRLIAAAAELRGETRMTTPLGEIEIGPREGRRVTVARTTNETEVTVTLGLDGEGHTGIDTGIGFYDHLLGSLAHHGLFDLAIHADGDLQVDEHHTVEDVALVLGAAFAEALGDRAGIARFGARAPSRWTKPSRPPSSTSAAGRTRSSTCRSAASVPAGCRCSSSSTPSRPSRGPPGPRST